MLGSDFEVTLNFELAFVFDFGDFGKFGVSFVATVERPGRDHVGLSVDSVGDFGDFGVSLIIRIYWVGLYRVGAFRMVVLFFINL